jgi:predicted amidohydrolase YtcJ
VRGAWEYRHAIPAAERVGLPTAIAAFMIGSAYVNHDGHEAGSIEPGRRADLVVMDRARFVLPAGRSPWPKWT